MASAWGDSWGSAWGGSWGASAASGTGARRRKERKQSVRHVPLADMAWPTPRLKPIPQTFYFAGFAAFTVYAESGVVFQYGKPKAKRVTERKAKPKPPRPIPKPEPLRPAAYLYHGSAKAIMEASASVRFWDQDWHNQVVENAYHFLGDMALAEEEAKILCGDF